MHQPRERRQYEDGTRSVTMRKDRLREEDNLIEVLTDLNKSWEALDVDQMKAFYTNESGKLIRTGFDVHSGRGNAARLDLEVGQKVAIRITCPADDHGTIRQRLYLQCEYIGIKPDTSFMHFTTDTPHINYTIERTPVAAGASR